jgi:hypothetical protein
MKMSAMNFDAWAEAWPGRAAIPIKAQSWASLCL